MWSFSNRRHDLALILLRILTCDVEECLALDASSICLRWMLLTMLHLYVSNLWRVFSKCSFQWHSAYFHFALYPSFAEKIRIEFSANYPLTTFRNPHSAKYPFPSGAGVTGPSFWLCWVFHIGYGNYVCLSVRLSHAGIVSKRRYVARCSLHCQIAKCV